VAVVREDRPGDRRLTGYVTAAGGGVLDPGRVRDLAGRVLPGHMVPAVVVVLAAVPLTANGKVDRRALPAPQYAAGAGRAVRGAGEEIVAGLFAEVLESEVPGAEDSFFDLGGHSLLAVRLVSRIRAVLGAELGVRDVFEYPTVAGLAARAGRAARARAGVAARPRPAVLPLSDAQRRLWFLDALEGPSAMYNIPVAFLLSGSVDSAALAAALADVAGRHESLRTVFGQDGGEPFQRILPPDEGVPVLQAARVGDGDLQEVLAAIAAQPFDLAADLPWRAVLISCGPGRQVLVLVVHHIAADGWSMGPLAADLSAAYTARLGGAAPGWAPLPAQYGDYTLWQRDRLGDAADPGSLTASELAYWRQVLHDLPAELTLPYDRPRSAGPAERGAALVRATAGSRVTRELRKIAAREGVSMFMVLHAAVAVLLTQHGAGEDIVLGTPVAGRGDEALEDLVGFFVNTLVLRTDTSGDPAFTELLARVRGSDLAAYAHQDLPFERLVEDLNPDRSLSRHPLFQTMLSYGTGQAPELTLPATTSRRVDQPITATPRFDLAIDVADKESGLYFEIGYDTSLFTERTVQGLSRRLIALLEAVAAEPDTPVGRLQAVTTAEREQILQQWNDTARQVTSATLPELFEAQASRTPNAVALAREETEVTYAELNARANQLARYLAREMAAGPEQVVAVALGASVELIVALLAVVKAGAAYLPLDPAYPPDRLDYMVRDANPLCVLTDAASGEGLSAERRVLLDDPGVVGALAGLPTLDLTDRERNGVSRPANLAYIIYTSGSTGLPKACSMTHAGMANLAANHRDALGLSPDSRVLQFASPGFDAMTVETFVTLLTGARLVLAPAGELLPGEALAATLARHKVTLAALPATALTVLPPDALVGELLAVAGEECPVSLARQWSRDRRLVNAYGPTEFSACATITAPLSSDLTAVPIGRPIANTRCLVLDRWLRLVPSGVTGELYLAGTGLARGYLGRPDLTAGRFVACPFGSPGERMYRTGDLARWTDDGELVFGGRADRQIKIRGFRVEPREIEEALDGMDGVKRALVVMREDIPDDRRLVGYVVPDSGPVLDPAAMRARLAGELPAYMVPAAIVMLDALPLTPNGKVDSGALPAPRYGDDAPYVAPRTTDENLVADVWAEVLGLERVSVHANFFELGGDSITGIKVVSRLRDRGFVITPRDLFRFQSVAALVAGGARTAPVPAEQGKVTGAVPLAPIQRWLFAQDQPAVQHVNQSMVLESRELDPAILERALAVLVSHHDVLRSRFVPGAAGWSQEIIAEHPGNVVTYQDLSGLAPADRERRWSELAARAQSSLDLAAGELVRAVLAEMAPGEGQRLLLVIHHLVVDVVSWSILLEDLTTACHQLAAGASPRLPAKTTSFQRWSARLAEYARTTAMTGEINYWTHALSGAPTTPPATGPAFARTVSIRIELPPEQTSALLHTAPAAYGATVEDILLAGLALAVYRWSGRTRVLIDVEGHGREQLFDDVDLSRTVGWFTTMHPLELAIPATGDLARVVGETVRRRRAVPGKGIGYGILKWLADPGIQQRVATLPRPDIAFNYLGNQHVSARGESFLAVSDAPSGPETHAANRLTHQILINAGAVSGVFTVELTCQPASSSPDPAALATHYRQAICDLVDQTASSSSADPVDNAITAARVSVARSGPLVDLNGSDAGPAIFCPPNGGGSIECYAQLAALLKPRASVFGFDESAAAAVPARIPDIASAYAAVMRARQPHGPYFLLGWSFGGLCALEIARDVIEAGEEVGMLCVIDMPARTPERHNLGREKVSLIRRAIEVLAANRDHEVPSAELLEAMAAIDLSPESLELGYDDVGNLMRILFRSATALSVYAPERVDCDVVLYEATESQWPCDLIDSWRGVVRSIDHRIAPGHHGAALSGPYLPHLAASVAKILGVAKTDAP
jgi:amino acid adenylation domain-containing protein/non-ribosomal peptide synthase protein (TIGR01720 family)